MTGSATPVEVLATDAWTARMQLTDRYARGRMFIAGTPRTRTRRTAVTASTPASGTP
jgi:hypothetical protein